VGFLLRRRYHEGQRSISSRIERTLAMLRRSHAWSCLLVSSVLSAILLVVGGARADWPQFRGPTGMGVSADKGLPLKWSQDSNLAWKVKLPGKGQSSPIIVSERIFLTAFSGYTPGQPGGMEQLRLHVLCLNRADGALLWDKTIDPKLPEQVKMREGHGYASQTPAADSERVYAFFGKSGVVAFTHDGQQLWRADVGSRTDGFGSGASLMLAGDLVIVTASVESQSLYALDKRSGKEVWKATGIREAYNTPILVGSGGKQELVVATMGKVMAFDPAAGTPLWSCNTDIGWYMVPSLVAEGDMIGCIGGRSGVAALGIRTGGKGDVTRSHRLWTGMKGSNVSSPILHEGHLYWINDVLGIAYCADVTTGKIVYEERLTSSGAYASPVLADGKIYYTSRMGQTYVIPARPTFELLATNDLRDRSEFNASPAISGGRIYLRSGNFLYCVGKQ
jgi:hypothetical protein